MPSKPPTRRAPSARPKHRQRLESSARRKPGPVSSEPSTLRAELDQLHSTVAELVRAAWAARDLVRGLPSASITAPQEPSKRSASGLTVGGLRQVLEGVHDGMEIVVRASSERDAWICGGISGGITHAGLDTGCGENADGSPVVFFAIEVSDDEADFDGTPAKVLDNTEIIAHEIGLRSGEIARRAKALVLEHGSGDWRPFIAELADAVQDLSWITKGHKST